jgi:hypothetical protein
METDLIDFIRSARGPFPLSVAASELESLGKAGAGWPTATKQDWIRKLRQLVADGKLIECDGMLTVAKAESLKQGELF